MSLVRAVALGGIPAGLASSVVLPDTPETKLSDAELMFPETGLTEVVLLPDKMLGLPEIWLPKPGGGELVFKRVGWRSNGDGNGRTVLFTLERTYGPLTHAGSDDQGEVPESIGMPWRDA